LRTPELLGFAFATAAAAVVAAVVAAVAFFFCFFFLVFVAVVVVVARCGAIAASSSPASIRLTRADEYVAPRKACGLNINAERGTGGEVRQDSETSIDKP
jgi:hypothetical protein